MRRRLLAAVILATVALPANLAAQPSEVLEPQRQAVIELPSERVSEALLTSITTWLSTNFELQPTTVMPKIRHASAAAMTQRRYRTLLGTDGPATLPTDAGPATVALYDRSEATIYLSLDWTGTTPAELSVLVHEMVHHLQHVAATRFECPQAREQLAYAAQQRWLGLFGRTLEGEFQIDPFTLLVTTRCMY